MVYKAQQVSEREIRASEGGWSIQVENIQHGEDKAMTDNLITAIEDCLINNTHKCDGCAYNPIPGRQWMYGCKAGQRQMLVEACARLESVEHVDHKMADTTDEGEWR